jgi:four helix bundle protein
MISKLGIVEEEADETMFWFELLAESKIMSADRLREAHSEADEILAMTVASKKTLRSASQIDANSPNRKSKIENRKSI